MTGVFLILAFLFFAVMMFRGKLPALLALPLLAFSLALIAGAPLATIVTEGIPRLQNAIFAVIIGGIFGQYLKNTGIGESLVRRVAELAGDNPLTLTLLLTVIVSFLFTTLGGLGSVMMVANIYFPVLLSLGIPPLLTGCIFLMALSLGGVFNIVNWALYMDMLGLSQEVVLHYALPFGLLFAVLLLIFVVVEFKRARLAVPLISLVKVIGGMVVVGEVIFLFVMLGPLPLATQQVLSVAYKIMLGALIFLPFLHRRFLWTALLAPFVPLSLVLFLGWNILTAFLFGMAYLFMTALKWKTDEALAAKNKLLIQSIIEGIQHVAPAIAVMLGIGMVLIAVVQPAVSQSLMPLIKSIIPRSLLGYVLTFGLLAPLALYRGPLNLWGMGSGLMGLLKGSLLLSNVSIMAAFFSTGQIQGVCDPTNTHNVWVANQLKVELNAILAKTLPYMWILAVVGLCLILLIK